MEVSYRVRGHKNVKIVFIFQPWIPSGISYGVLLLEQQIWFTSEKNVCGKH